MARVNFVPLGSIVQLEGGTQKLMVVARGLNVKRGEKTYFFDYGGVQYPQGLSGDQLAYFNHEAIRSLAYIGCNDRDNQIMVETLNTYIEKHEELQRCTPEEWAESAVQSADNMTERDLPDFEEVRHIATQLEGYNQQLNNLVMEIDRLLHEYFVTEREYRQFAPVFSDIKGILYHDFPCLLSDVAQYYRKIAYHCTIGVPPDWYCEEHPDWREKHIQMIKNYMATM